MFTKHSLILTVLLFAFYVTSAGVQAAQIKVTGKHTRTNGSIHDFEVVDGDALSPGDRFQIIIDAKTGTYYSVLYFSRDGKGAQIFPVTGRIGRIPAGKRQFIPDANNYFTLDVSGGRELMFVVTSTNEISNLRSVLRGAESVASSAGEIHAYLKKRLPGVYKLEITNTGKKLATSTDQISSSLIRDISATYSRNPWPDSVDEGLGRERVRSGEDSTIPDAVRRRTAEVRSLLGRPKGTPGSSSLRTVKIDPSVSSAPSSGEIRRDANLLVAQKEKQMEEQKLRQARLAEEENERQKKMEAARLAREAAEEEAQRLREERELAEQLELERQKEAEKQAEQLRQQRLAMEKAEAEAEEQARLKAIAEERKAAEAEAEEQARLKAIAEERKVAEAEAAAALAAERQALALAEEEAIRIEQDRLLAEQARIQKEQAETEARLLAEQRAAEEERERSEETRRRAEIMAEEQSIRAEQQALDEKIARQKELAEQQQLAEQEKLAEQKRMAEQEKADGDKKDDKGVFGNLLAFVSGGDTKKPETKKADKDRQVVELDSTGEVVLSESVSKTPVVVSNAPAEAPRPAVVVLKAPARPEQKKLSAPAPSRASQDSGKPLSATGEAAKDMAAQVASAIVSIRTSNDPQAAGFILDSKGHILTGWHVINGVTDIDVSFIAISGAERTYKAKVVKYDKFHDLALLKLIDAPQGIQPIIVSTGGLPDAGARVRVFGQKNGQMWATEDAVITRIAPQFTWFSSDNVIHRGEILQVDLPVEGKSIGSLVTTMDYQMLGVKSFSGTQTGRTYAVSVRTIRDFVEAKGEATQKPATQ